MLQIFKIFSVFQLKTLTSSHSSSSAGFAPLVDVTSDTIPKSQVEMIFFLKKIIVIDVDQKINRREWGDERMKKNNQLPPRLSWPNKALNGIGK